MRTVLATLLFFALFAGLFGCETQQPYAQCELDPEVTKKVCNGTGSAGSSTGTTSCVVTAHPHCDLGNNSRGGVCISFFNRQSVCTQSCTKDIDCELGGVCWAFSGSASYCVPKDQFCEVNKTANNCP